MHGEAEWPRRSNPIYVSERAVVVERCIYIGIDERISSRGSRTRYRRTPLQLSYDEFVAT